MTVYQKRAFYLSLLLVIAASFIIVVQYFTLVPGATLSSTMHVLLAGIVVALGCAYFARRGWVTTAVITLIVALFATVGFSITESAGLGIYLVIFSAIVSLGIISQTLPVEKFRSIVYIVAIASITLLFLDLFYPYPRAVATNTGITIAVTAAISLVVAVLIGRDFPRYPLRIKMTLTFLVVTLIPLIILAVFNNSSTQQILTKNANESLLAGATQTANRVDEFIETGLATVRSEARLLSLGDTGGVSYSTELTIEDRNRIATILTAFQSKDPVLIQSYGFIDRNGIVVADTVSGNIGRDESAHEYFRRPLGTARPYASSVQFVDDGRGGIVPVIHFSQVVNNRQGVAIGVLRARYDAFVLQQIVEDASGFIGDRAYVALYDENGFSLAHSQDHNRLYKFLTWPDPHVQSRMRTTGLLPPNFQTTRGTENNVALAAMLSQRDETSIFEVIDTTSSDEIKLVAVAASDHRSWLVTAFQPQSAVLPPIVAQTRSTTILSLVLAGLAVMIALLVSQELVRPLANLRETADQITAGELGARATVAGEDEFGTLGKAFNTMTEQLQQTLAFLETRVLERTRALELASQLSRSLSTILDPDQLVKTVVEQVQTAFNYYHAHIYLLDEKDNTLHMVGGTGQAGQTMLKQGHKIPYGKGLVGRAAATNQVVLIPSVADNPDWLPNPLLPDTQAEIAVPISIGNEVLGVLDVQHNMIGGLTDQDANLLQAVANQVAIALRNAREYRQAQARAERQQVLNQINQKILTTQNMEEALQIAVRELGQAVGATRTRARLHAVQATNGDANDTTEG
jgi:putative methionine-R-sulfoxide reductase with GAF domain